MRDSPYEPPSSSLGDQGELPPRSLAASVAVGTLSGIAAFFVFMLVSVALSYIVFGDDRILSDEWASPEIQEILDAVLGAALFLATCSTAGISAVRFRRAGWIQPSLLSGSAIAFLLAFLLVFSESFPVGGAAVIGMLAIPLSIVAGFLGRRRAA